MIKTPVEYRNRLAASTRDRSTKENSLMRIEDVGGWRGVLGALTAGTDLTTETTRAVITTILAGEATDAQISAFIVALRVKGETTDELVGMREAALAASTPLTLPDNAVDIVGVGGSAARRESALNVSTMAAFVASAAGATVCKHGNRKASSTSGAFDLLEALGVNVGLAPESLADCVAEVGVGFALAPAFHPAFRHVGPVRRELEIPTVFNVLGPLSHPGQPKRQVIGVADLDMAPKMADVLAATGSKRSLVVTGHGAIDEFSVTGPSVVHDVNNGEVTSYEVDPTDCGVEPRTADQMAGGDAAANAEIATRIFAGDPDVRRGMIVLNAAAGLVAAGVAATLADAVIAANAAIDNGGAAAKVAALVEFTNR